LYAVNETDRFGGQRAGAVSAFRIDPASGKLTLLNQQPSGGTGPCHLSVDKTGKCLLVANYGSGSVAAFKIGPTGQLSEPVTTVQHQGSSTNPQRQSSPHAHQIVPDPKNRLALVCDLGLDQVLIYKLNSVQARLSAHDPPFGRLQPGAGPRHLVFHPRGTWLYVVNELNSTLTTFAYQPRSGTLTELGTISTLPEGLQDRNSGAEVQVHPSGKYVYSSNRGDNSIAIFQVNPASGIAQYVGRESTQGKTPRHFAIHPAGHWLIAENQDSDTLVPFRIDPDNGQLTPSGKPLHVGSPVCLVFVPARR
jgi:6-phosphogluconolactonase